MSVHQKLGIILESKEVQKLSLEKNVLNKKCSPKLIFLGAVRKLRKHLGVLSWSAKCLFY